jgi:hypothetical protein
MTAKSMPLWAVIVSALLVLWSLAGLWSYYSSATMTSEMVAQLPQAQQDAWSTMPKFLWIDFFVAVAAGAVGAIGLLLKKSWAAIAYIVSLAAIVIQFGYIFLLTPILTTIGPSAAIFPFVIFILGLIAYLFARKGSAMGWLS